MQTYKWLILFILLFTWRMIYAQPGIKPGYGESYEQASEWLKENHWIEDSLTAYHIPPGEAIAIVFPELMRYSTLEDKMEVAGLMVLYARLGKDYADFSVGRFQMKPSFIQQLEADAGKYLSQQEIQRICPFLLNGKDSEAIRRKRVNSLTNVKNEVAYLALFFKICLMRFKPIRFKSEEERIRFLATAYNCGYHHAAKDLFVQMKKKLFPVYNGLMIQHLNYAHLSLVWWKENERENKLAMK